MRHTILPENPRFIKLRTVKRLSRAALHICAVTAAFLLLLAAASAAWADTPVTLFRSIAGNINITGTGSTLRTAADGTNSCSVTNSGSMQLSGVPVGSTIVAAYLYWAGSGGDPAGGAAADYNVTFNGTNISADRTYTAWYNVGGGNVLYFFGGVKDVTSMITGNATYTFSNLAVQNADVTGGGQYCSNAAVLSAFALVVVYSNPGETLHVVNLWEGLQTYRGNSIALTPTNFTVPTPAPITALSSRHLVLTWEGDSGNSNAFNGFNENLTFCAPAPCAGTALTDAYNPVNNQFNSTVDVPPSGPFSGINTTWGVDLDMYDVTGRLGAGNASARAVYSSGGDLVILANQTMSIANVPVADLAITKSHTGSFKVGTNGVYTINVTNNGPSPTSGTITVTDTLPTGLTYVSATGTGWTCGAAGQTVTCTRPSPLNSGASAPAITLTASVGAAAYPNVTNTATVSSGAFDNVSGNNSVNDFTIVLAAPVVTKAFTATNLALNGTTTMTITVQNTNSVPLSTVAFTDTYPAGLTNSGTPGAAVAPAGCTSTLTAANNGPSFALSSGTAPAATTCTYTVQVMGTTAGAKANTTGAVTSANAPTGTAANATVNVYAPPTITKSFGAPSIPIGGATTMALTLGNPAGNVAAITGVRVDDTFPVGLTLQNTTFTFTPLACGTVTNISGAASAAGDNNLRFSVASIAIGATCQVVANVTSSTAGSITNTTNAPTATGPIALTGSTANASLTVYDLPLLSILKSANVGNANPGQIITYTVQIVNTGAGIGTNVVLRDDLSPYAAFSLNTYGVGIPFSFTDSSPASGLTLGAPEYSNNNGSTWLYSPVSGGGGAPAGYDGNVTNWRIPMTGNIRSGGSFTLNYQVIVK